MKVTRIYHFKDIEMLLAGKTIVENLKAHLGELSTERPNWTDEFVITITTRIDNAISDFLGLDPKKNLRGATRAIHEVQTPALKDLAFFKTQIEADFIKEKSKRDEILPDLGFSAHLKEVQTKNQEALVQLLYVFKKNVTDNLKTEITSKGMSVNLINRIIDYADTLKSAGVTQETLKGSSKSITETVITEFNEIYTQVESVCKIASKYFIVNQVVKDKFIFSKIVDHMTASKSTTSKDNPLNSTDNPATTSSEPSN